MPKKTWGGSRKGAGRKAAPGGTLVVLGMVSVKQDRADWAKKEQKKTGISLGALLRTALDKAFPLS